MHQRSQPSLRPALRHAVLLASLATAATPALPAASLRPTHASLLRQSAGARQAGFTYLESDAQVDDFVRRGLLVTLSDNDDYTIHPDVRHPAARPEVKLFVERLAHEYRQACGEPLVVTSLVRPRDRQPWNSDPLSVHPTGMAVDLRISAVSACRRWLEGTLLDLERRGWIEAAREHVVPHYHVVVFPSYVEGLEHNGIELPAAGNVVLASAPAPGPAAVPALAAASDATQALAAGAALPLPASGPTAAGGATSSRATATIRKPAAQRHSVSHATARHYKVRRGDSLWSIAHRNGISVQALRHANHLPSRLQPGQVLAIPAR